MYRIRQKVLDKWILSKERQGIPPAEHNIQREHLINLNRACNDDELLSAAFGAQRVYVALTAARWIRTIILKADLIHRSSNV